MKTIFDFKDNANLEHWAVVNDGVMGGISQAKFIRSSTGSGVYSGNVSLENNGGFSSVHYKFNALDVSNYAKVRLKIKGDGKIYQFRIKENQEDKHAYITKLQTTGEWQEIEILLKEMYPTFRGKKVDLSNFSSSIITQIAFLIANKKAETFELQISDIKLL